MKNLKLLNESHLTLALSTLFITLMLFGCKGKESQGSANQSEKDAIEQAIEEGVIEEDPDASYEYVGKWMLSTSPHTTGNMGMNLNYPSYQILINVNPANSLHAMLCNIILQEKKDDGKNLPIAGEFTLKIGDSITIKPETNSSQWNITGEQAEKILDVFDKGNFDFVFYNSTDDQTYKFDVGAQTRGAKDAYDKLYQLENQ